MHLATIRTPVACQKDILTGRHSSRPGYLPAEAAEEDGLDTTLLPHGRVHLIHDVKREELPCLDLAFTLDTKAGSSGMITKIRAHDVAMSVNHQSPCGNGTEITRS